MNTFKSINSLGVIHGDVRAENILIADGGNKVWIVDFELAEIVKRASEAESMIRQETEAVKELQGTWSSVPEWIHICCLAEQDRN